MSAATPSDAPAFDAEAYAREAAALLGLPLDPRHLPGVAANLRLAARMAAAVEGWALTPADEPAPVFVAGRDVPG
jgi:Protein of unknown function (DUF4089)